MEPSQIAINALRSLPTGGRVIETVSGYHWFPHLTIYEQGDTGRIMYLQRLNEDAFALQDDRRMLEADLLTLHDAESWLRSTGIDIIEWEPDAQRNITVYNRDATDPPGSVSEPSSSSSSLVRRVARLMRRTPRPGRQA